MKLYATLGIGTCAALAALAFAALAQDDVAQECHQACYEAEERCYEACETADDLEVCEAQCAEEAEACLLVCD